MAETDCPLFALTGAGPALREHQLKQHCYVLDRPLNIILSGNLSELPERRLFKLFNLILNAPCTALICFMTITK